MNYTDINIKTIERWIGEGWEWGQSVDHETFERARKGEWEIVLTPKKSVPREWFGAISGKRVLGLASGGGQQMPILSAVGAVCTVLDYSYKQLEAEINVAAREGYDIRTIRADMTKPLPFEDESFDLIIHPVSNCYIREIKPLWKECARVLKKGGRLLSGMDSSLTYLFEDGGTRLKFPFPFDPLVHPEQMESLKRTDSGVQFSHSLEEQIGGQIEAGFAIIGFYEDESQEENLKSFNIPGFFATCAVKL